MAELRGSLSSCGGAHRSRAALVEIGSTRDFPGAWSGGILGFHSPAENLVRAAAGHAVHRSTHHYREREVRVEGFDGSCETSSLQRTYGVPVVALLLVKLGAHDTGPRRMVGIFPGLKQRHQRNIVARRGFAGHRTVLLVFTQPAI